MNHLVLLHGALGHSAQFENLIAELEFKNITVTAIDLPGHGLNPYSSDAITIPLMAEALLFKLEEKGITEPVNIFGHSLGGYIGLYLCLKFPNKVGSLFTLGTKWHWTAQIAEKETSLLNPDKMEQKIPAYVELLKKIHGNNWKDLLSSIVFLMKDLGLNEYCEPEYLSEISKSIRIGLGDTDIMVSFEETLNTFRALPAGQLQVYPNTPHPYEKVEIKRLAEDLVDFFGY